MGDRIAVIATRALFLLAALFWSGVALLVKAGTVYIGAVDEKTATVLMALMLCAAVAMVFFAWQSLRGRWWIDMLAVVAAVLNIVATLTDEVGLIDLAYLVFSVALLAFLVRALLGRRRTAGKKQKDRRDRASSATIKV